VWKSCALRTLRNENNEFDWPEPYPFGTRGECGSGKLKINNTDGNPAAALVLITVTPSHFMRFADVVETKAGDRVFGHTKWRTVAECESPADKRRFLGSSPTAPRAGRPGTSFRE